MFSSFCFAVVANERRDDQGALFGGWHSLLRAWDFFKNVCWVWFVNLWVLLEESLAAGSYNALYAEINIKSQ